MADCTCELPTSGFGSLRLYVPVTTNDTMLGYRTGIYKPAVILTHAISSRLVS